jgi:hypothetical protein
LVFAVNQQSLMLEDQKANAVVAPEISGATAGETASDNQDGNFNNGLLGWSMTDR